MSLDIIGIKPGDEVIATPQTCFASNVGAIHRGARIRWADIDPLTGLIDPVSVGKLVNDKTKKIKSFEIDRCLRAIKSASTHGIAQWESKVYPLASIKAGKFYAEKFYKFISSIGAIIT